MKRLISILSVITLVFSACSFEGNNNVSSNNDAAIKENEVLIESNLKAMAHLVGYDGSTALSDRLFDGSDVYYISVPGFSHSEWYVYDKQSGTCESVCKIDGCKHDNKSCNACMISASHNYMFWNGLLYWSENHSGRNEYLYCLDPESGVKAQIHTIEETDEKGHINHSLYYFNGYALHMRFKPDSNPRFSYCKINVNSDESITVLNELTDEINAEESVSRQMQIGEKVYIFLNTLASEKETEKSLAVYSYNMETDEAKVEHPSVSMVMDNGEPFANNYSLHVIYNDSAYISDEEYRIYRLDLATGLCTFVFDFSEYGDIYDYANDTGNICRMKCYNDVFYSCIKTDETSFALVAKDTSGKIVFESDLGELEFGEGIYTAIVLGTDEEQAFICVSVKNASIEKQSDIILSVSFDTKKAEVLCENMSAMAGVWYS